MEFWTFLFGAFLVGWVLIGRDAKRNNKPLNETRERNEEPNASSPSLGPRVAFSVEHIDDSNRADIPIKSRTHQPGPCSLSITYTGYRGITTKHDVSVYKSKATNRGFDAWSALLQDRRTFFFTGISEGVDLTTGEILSRADIYKRIHPGRKVPEQMDR